MRNFRLFFDVIKIIVYLFNLRKHIFVRIRRITPISSTRFNVLVEFAPRQNYYRFRFTTIFFSSRYKGITKSVNVSMLLGNLGERRIFEQNQVVREFSVLVLYHKSFRVQTHIPPCIKNTPRRRNPQGCTLFEKF